jgi:hypothetical protein
MLGDVTVWRWMGQVVGRRWSRLPPRRRPVVLAAVLAVLALLTGTGLLVAHRPETPQPIPRSLFDASSPYLHLRPPLGVFAGFAPTAPPPGSATSSVSGERKPGPVIIIPGYGGGRGNLTDLVGALRANGRRAFIMRLPGDGTGDLADQARALQDLVRRFLAGGYESVDVVGYSAGGVVARLWLVDDGGATEARRVVTLGSPLHGAQIAAVGAALVPDACPVACQQLVPGSPLLRRLDAVPLPAGVRWLSVWTENDRTVEPPDSARLAGAVNVDLQDVCPDAIISHGDLPSDPLVTGLVRNGLSGTPLIDPGPRDCGWLRLFGQT